jgi:hypothetical protein
LAIRRQKEFVSRGGGRWSSLSRLKRDRDDTCNLQTFIFIIRSPADACFRWRADKCKPEYSFSFRVAKQAFGWLKVFYFLVINSNLSMISKCLEFKVANFKL